MPKDRTIRQVFILDEARLHLHGLDGDQFFCGVLRRIAAKPKQVMYM